MLETPNARHAEIAIADTGIGIRNSYLNGTNEDAVTRIDKGANPIQIAVDGLNSSKKIANPDTLRSHFGFGLLVVRRLIEENGGQLLIVSGADTWHLD